MGPDTTGKDWKKNQEFLSSAPLKGGLTHRPPEKTQETLLRGKSS
jgi:hypothetical protein